jgi:hypothetical protein
MVRLLKIWLTLLAAYWLGRAMVSLVLFETADRSLPGLVEVAAVPALQAALIGWLSRGGQGGRTGEDGTG